MADRDPLSTQFGESFEEWLARNYPNQFPGQLRAAYEAGYRSGLQAGIDRYSEADLRKLAESILEDEAASPDSPPVGFGDQLSAIDAHLDGEVAQAYKDQPLAQDWARVAKVAEELGECIGALILYTGQNPRKRQRGDTASLDDLLGELADTAITAMLGMTHYTKDGLRTVQIITNKLRATYERIAAYAKAAS